MMQRWFGRAVLFVATSAFCAGGSAAAGDWVAAKDDEPDGIGRASSRLALHIGGSFGAVHGSEVEDVKSAAGFEAGLSFRVIRSISIQGSYARSKGTVDGQLVQLLDQPIRADGRSGYAEGEITFSRFRAGLRIDGWRQQRWPVQMYFAGAAVFTTNKVALDRVDHDARLEPIPVAGGGEVNLGGFEDQQIGILGRIGMEYRVTRNLGVDLGFNYEIFEPPPGTNATAALSGGLTIRI